MWLFVLVCYFLTLLTSLLLLTVGAQGYFHFMVGNANHPAFALLTIIVYLFTQTLIFWFFIGTGSSIKDYTKANQVDPTFYDRTKKIKGYLYPAMMMNMFLMMVAFILGGAVHTHKIPGWVHGAVFILAALHFIKTLRLQHQGFKENHAVFTDLGRAAAP